MRNESILLSGLCWLEVLEPRHRCAGMVSHGMGMAMREDHQITFAEQHRLVSPFHGEPARSSRDKMEARKLSARHEENPGCAHGSATIQGTVQVHRLE